MRKRIVRLTESGLTRLVKRIINEQENDYTLPLNGPGRAFLEGATSNEVYEFLSDLPSDTQFLALINCEKADFRDIDLCHSKIEFINLNGTPNNLLKTNRCFTSDDYGFYSRSKFRPSRTIENN